MSTRAAKFFPIGVVAGAIGYLCWPYLDEPATAPQPKGQAKAIELTVEMLSPPAAPPLSRDPFGSLNASDKSTVKSARRGSASAKPGGALSIKSSGAPSAKSGGAPSAKSGGALQVRAEPTASAPSTFILNGTYLLGDRRMAVINDALYAEGDQILASQAVVPNCSVARVDFDRVVLNLGGETAELLYRDPTAPAPAVDLEARPAANVATPAPPKNLTTAADGQPHTGPSASGEKQEPKSTPAGSPALAPREADVPPAAASDVSGKTN